MSDQKKEASEMEDLGNEILGEIDTDALEKNVEEEVEEALGSSDEQEPEEEMEIAIPLSERDDLSPEEAEALKEQEIQRLLQVLSRGIVNDQLQRIVDEATPEGYHSKFVRDTPGDVTRYKNLGFGFTYRDGATGSHGTGDGRIKHGDVVLMTIPPDRFEILQEVRRRQIVRKLGEGRRDYNRRVAEAQEKGVVVAPSFDESETVIRKETV